MCIISLLSAPCPPTILTASTDCGTSMATLSWAPTEYAISYTTTATGNRSNHVASCSSNTTSCSMNLLCGDQYTAALVASSEICNSSTGANLTFPSGDSTQFSLHEFHSRFLFQFSESADNFVYRSSLTQLPVCLTRWLHRWTATPAPLQCSGGRAWAILCPTLQSLLPAITHNHLVILLAPTAPFPT